MRIYLDSCVIQDLKNDKFLELLTLVESDRERNIYCFSEAHIQDLERDKTDQKFHDLKFLEKIVGNNCFFYDKKIRFEHLTPTAYYNMFDWSTCGLSSVTELFPATFATIFEAIPLPFKELIPLDKLPNDFPTEFLDLLSQSTNFYEFMRGFMDFTDKISNEQKKFKKFIKYLHQNSLVEDVYKSLNIDGFDGSKITNKEKFRTSYAAYFLKEGQEKYRYQLFIDMYCGLETFGFVKGKLKKQQLMNMINDARHAFFGAFCDIVVSKDEDFINKTRFMYDSHEIKTNVITMEDLQSVVLQPEKPDGLFKDLISEFDRFERMDILDEDYNEIRSYTTRALQSTHLGYFNTLTFVNGNDQNFCFFSHRMENLSTGTLIKEISRVVDKLVRELGTDIDGKGPFDSNEIVEEKWIGRNWIIGDFLVELNYINKMHLKFSQIK